MILYQAALAASPLSTRSHFRQRCLQRSVSASVSAADIIDDINVALERQRKDLKTDRTGGRKRRPREAS